MCGIAGIVALSDGASPTPLDTLRRMAAAIEHRGPDEFGVYRDARAGLAHARLSIIDLASGQQPLANEDDTLFIVFNGEIFNYVELRAELEALGHRMRTRSDTEVIVHAYEQWGDDAFSRFNGQWAIALWDAARRRLVLSRDRLGVRPLYLCEHDGKLYFASEVKAIFAADPSIPRAFDPLGLEQTFTFWSVVPPRTVFAGVSELRPGFVRTYEAGAMREHAYFRPRFPIAGERLFRGSIDDATAAVHSALEEATRLRMVRADVPVGSYLSGGLDSSLIAALAHRNAGARLETFSLRFADDEYDESDFQHRMVERLGSKHVSVVCTRDDIARVFPDVVTHAERPLLRTAPAPLFLLSKLVRDSGIKVVLTGEGADEVFAGYDLFREGKVRRFWAKHPASRWRPRLLERLYPYLARSPVAQQAMARQFFGRGLEGHQSPGFSHQTRWQTTNALGRLFSNELRAQVQDRDVVRDLLDELPPELPRWSPLAQDQWIEITTLLTGYLLCSQGDRMLMANSVEGRFPFLDPNVVALANTLPDAYKLRVLDEKHVLKRVARGLVPDEIIARKKQPYRAPDALSFAGADRPSWIAEVLDPRAIEDAGVFAPDRAKQLWDKCIARGNSAQFSNTDNMAVVGLLSTQLLHARLIRSTPKARDIELRTTIDRLGESTT